ncbi:MAG: ABC transporter permease [Segniliparus sp.]|uniref:ABC transporter permease n=1 Tax=Segniliparus sp. TaxID=2804064 RepID=UPI003F31301E
MSAEPEGNAFTATLTLLRADLRVDRTRILVWALSLGLLAAYIRPMYATMYPTVAARAARVALVRTPAAVFMTGPHFDGDQTDIGAMIANQLSSTLLIATSLMSILFAVRHSRADEESGPAELLRSKAIGRLAPLAAAWGVVKTANLAVAAAIALGLAATGSPVLDSAALGAGVGLTGMAFGALALLAAQLAEHSRVATGIAMAALAVAFVLSGVGDLQDAQGSAIAWFSPLNWPQQTRAFVGLRLWPLLLPALLAAVALASAFALAERRDFGQGFLRGRTGPRTASRRLAGVLSLSLRLQRGTFLGWGTGLALMGLAMGSFANALGSTLRDNPRAAAIFGHISGDDLAAAFFATFLRFGSVAVAAYTVAAMLRLAKDQADGIGELILAGSVSRARSLAGPAAATLLADAGLLALWGSGMGVSGAAVTGDARWLWRLPLAALGYLPAQALFIALAALLFAWRASWTSAAWLLVLYTAVASVLGPLLRLPRWSTRLSPFEAVPNLPAAAFSPAGPLALVLIAAAMFGGALAVFRRRDYSAG